MSLSPRPEECGIYQIRHIATGKRYIGSSAEIPQRWITHRRDLEHGRHHSRYLQRAWRMYGADAFVFETIEIGVDPEQLFAREQYYFDLRLAEKKTREYNMTHSAYGSRGATWSIESRQRQAERVRGTKWSEERRASFRYTDKMRAANIAKRGMPPTQAMLVEWKLRRERPLTPKQIAYNLAKRGRPATPAQLEGLRIGWNTPHTFVMTPKRREFYERRRGTPAHPNSRKGLEYGWGRPLTKEEHAALLKASADKRRGVPLTPEHRAKIGKAHSERTYSEDQMRKLAATQAARIGTHHAESTRQKMKDAWVLRRERQQAEKEAARQQRIALTPPVALPSGLAQGILWADDPEEA